MENESSSPLARAARALMEADWVLVASGAGLSADSGLETYEALGPDYDQLCRAELLYEDTERFQNFWLSSLLKYRAQVPHEGFQVLEGLLRERADMGRVYLYTSNVDGHLRQLRGFPLCELHGCCEDWICSARLTPEADHAPRWARVRAAQEELLRGGTACREPMTVRMEGGLEEVPLKCHCGLPLRPCVLMFGDEDEALLQQLQKAWAQYQCWEDAMEEEISGSHLVILEIGVGRRVEVVRQECEEVLRDVNDKGGRTTLIRVNLDEEILSRTPAAHGSEIISLKMSALAFLRHIAQLVELHQ
ncbi:unnamed protein product [Durusdinium trenchii]|uniref:NAD-dependent protein deacylase 2 (Regulatory protein SIR2 homolog 2) n=2 Tax=Durusdinium trenchii TaxID=1381693 RepID=A0ABP0RGI7_9DINO